MGYHLVDVDLGTEEAPLGGKVHEALADVDYARPDVDPLECT